MRNEQREEEKNFKIKKKQKNYCDLQCLQIYYLVLYIKVCQYTLESKDNLLVHARRAEAVKLRNGFDKFPYFPDVENKA